MFEKVFPWISLYLLFSIYYRLDPNPVDQLWPVLMAVGTMMAISLIRLIRGK